MAGILSTGVPHLPLVSGGEFVALDTNLAGGVSPQMAIVSLSRLAIFMNYLGNNLSTTTVAGTRLYVSVNATPGTLVTGVIALIGATGGTDKFIYELHDNNGVLVATTALAGVTVGTAGTYQQIPFTAPITIPNNAVSPYFIVVQSNGTTAKVATINAPTSALLTGSATGTFGTSAAITPPTTYTAGVGPVAILY
jgi:hypothetical protein